MLFLKKIFHQILNIIYPNSCICCDKFINLKGLFCLDCFKKLEFISSSNCKHCASPISIQTNFKEQSTCLKCLNYKNYFDFAYAIFVYNKTISKPIINLKYNDQTYLAYQFAKLLRTNFHNLYQNSDYVICVPLHRQKLLKRKFNQANLIARNFAKEKYLANAILRIANDSSQVFLSKKQRAKNLNNSFAINPKVIKKINNKKILLIDDVMTTGSTLNSCCKVLKKYNVKEISVAVIAKVILN